MATGSIFSQPSAKKSVLVPATPTRVLLSSAVGPKRVEVGKGVLFASAVVRQRIDANSTDLEKYTPHAHIRAKALQSILETNVDKLDIEYVMGIGQSQQEAHKAIAVESLGLTTDDTLEKCKSGINELIVDINQCTHPEAQTGLLSKIGLGKRVTQATFDAQVAELTAKAKDLHDLTDGLQILLHRCKSIREKIDKIKLELEPIIVQCQFFSEYTRDNFPQPLYIARLSGLLTTITTLNQNIVQLNAFEQTIIQLIDTILQVTLTDLPLWLTNCTNTTLKTSILNKLQHHGQIQS